MRALVLWAHDTSPNLGVRVLAAGTEALLRRVWPDADVAFHNYGAGTAPVRIGSLAALARETVVPRRGLSEWFRRFDLVVDTRAGDSLTDIYGWRRLSQMTAAAESIARARVPLVLGPQTIGPFSSRYAAALARRSLHSASLVLARDHESAAAAEQLGRSADAVTTDVVFALDPPAPAAPRDVLLNISGLLWQPNRHVRHEDYRAAVRSTYDALVDSGREVGLLAHVLPSSHPDDDGPAVRDFARSHAPGAEVLIPTTLTETRSILAGSTLVIGSRMHACLNALSVGTSAIALAYSRKFAPLLADLGWPHVLDLRVGPTDPGSHVLATSLLPDLDQGVLAVRDRAEESLQRATQVLADRLVPT